MATLPSSAVSQGPDDPVLAELVQKLTEALHPERIYLFGSRARGEAGPDSDYDLLLVLPESDVPRSVLYHKASAVLWETGTAADVLLWGREAFDRRAGLKASLPAVVLREGALLYAA